MHRQADGQANFSALLQMLEQTCDFISTAVLTQLLKLFAGKVGTIWCWFGLFSTGAPNPDSRSHAIFAKT